MNLKWVNTVRWKFLAIVLASLGLTAILLYLGYQLGVYLITVPPFTNYLNFIVVNYGSPMVMSIVGPILFIILYYLLTPAQYAPPLSPHRCPHLLPYN